MLNIYQNLSEPTFSSLHFIHCKWRYCINCAASSDLKGTSLRTYLADRRFVANGETTENGGVCCRNSKSRQTKTTDEELMMFYASIPVVTRPGDRGRLPRRPLGIQNGGRPIPRLTIDKESMTCLCLDSCGHQARRTEVRRSYQHHG